MPRYEGRLELTWTNKHERLLAHDDGSYEWLPASDYRVAEVRLLRNIGDVGGVRKRRAEDNLLIRGDALSALTSLTKLPEFRREYVGKVKVAYLDPPFNTGQAFSHYDDALEHSVWLTMMRDRLLQIWELLREDGSVWVHLDDSEASYCRVLLDELFGRENFVTSVVWEKDQGRRNDTDISTVHDYILVFAKNRQAWKKTRNLLPRLEDQIKRYRNPDNDPRGPWLQGADSTAKSGTEKNRFEVLLPSGRQVRPPKGVYWRFSPDTFDQALFEGRVYFGADGNGMPIIKRYLTDVQQGVVPRTWWPASEVGSNMSAKRDHLRKLLPDVEPFATPKPEPLLHRILHIASNPGDIVLDCFAGSGTTAAVAQKMGRRWVAIERVPDTVETYTLPRLTKVLKGEDPGGITSLVGWTGGGVGFRVLDVAPSMFESENGLVYLHDAMSNGDLAEATAAQLGYEYKPEPPFAGLKGRTRLAVVDGVVNEDVVRLLVSALADSERVVICGTGLDSEARAVLRELRPGSSLRKIPAALLERYRAPHRRVRREAPESTAEPVLTGTDA
ncbi:site-specific DNA-methyltransferase [Blastococcus saxobsidens]|uniref:DNA methylase n=1 Tax=Blastococcus saxobsidens TaxID=138336 RepID=A0A4Q7Y9D2_9ACTN|nr:site-specific DNA-methyltransferase [Blastococcus saxobsidens]RZU33398.1 DNA methylase [Blastococcus saxobsidens]